MADFSGGSLFTPSVIERLGDGSGAVVDYTEKSFSGSYSTSSNSYVFDDPGSPLKSTQQIPIDWSKFENHTFFNSAESKVNVAFDTIINFYPFDGSNQDVQNYLDTLSGYEKYVLNKFPNYRGYLLFSGTQASETSPLAGTYINVTDQAGSLYPALSKDRTGENVLDPKKDSFAFQFWINVPSETNDCQVITQKLSANNHGFSVFLSESASTTSANLIFLASSGSNVLSASYTLPKNEFVHITTNFNRQSTGLSKLEIFKSGSLVAQSQRSAEFGILDFSANSLLIGSGTQHSLGSLGTLPVVPKVTLSASIDDYRIYHSSRTRKKIRDDYLKNPDPSEDLRIYYKFNEPSGSFSNNSVILDSSGNSLHSKVSNFKITSRENRAGKSPVSLENKERNIVLFPSYPTVVTLNQKLLSSASQYDNNNPNLITNLIPRHYLLESNVIEGFEDSFAGTGDDYAFNPDFPGGGRIGQPQLIASLLFTWAKFFDEIKLFVDHFGSLLKVDYDENGGISDWMLPFLSHYYGFQLPSNFSNASYSQYLLGENLDDRPGVSQQSLLKVQTEIWRRILTNLNYIIQSKGTIDGIKSLMRAAGINPDKMFRFREFGGSRTITVSDARVKRTEVAAMLHVTSSTDKIISPYLSSSRVEPGWPYASNQANPTRSDGQFTSGSWSFEGIYEFSENFKADTPVTQSLVRMFATGSSGVASSGPGALISNLVAFSTGSKRYQTGSIKLFARPSYRDDAPTLNLILTGVNIFDKDKWHVSFGRSIGSSTGSFTTASYFIHAGKSNAAGEISKFYQTSSIFYLGPRDTDLFSQGLDTFNASGSYFQIGNGSSSDTIATTGNKFLNSAGVVGDSDSRTTALKARISSVRFWSKALSVKESKEHTRNFKSLGVEDPNLNFNFVKNTSGSWEKLRIDASVDQVITESNSSGRISIFDFSQNNFHLTGSGFAESARIIKPELFSYSILDPNFDQRHSDNKVRILGFQKDINAIEFNTLKSPVRRIQPGQPTLDDPRFSIEVSVAQAINEDIMNILAGLDWLDNAIGNPELQFASDYPKLRSLRDVYFQRLSDKVNFRNLFMFYKWFDDSLSIFIDRLIPSSTKYLGINFVIESHFLERSKFRNINNNIYLAASDRREISNDLLIALLTANLKRF